MCTIFALHYSTFCMPLFSVFDTTTEKPVTSKLVFPTAAASMMAVYVGVPVGACLLIALVVILLILICRKRKREKQM